MTNPVTAILSRAAGLFGAKAQRNADRFMQATVIEGMGRGPKPRPFRQDKAVRRYSDWVYAATLLNAQATSAVPLRLYVRKRKGRKCLFTTREVSRVRKNYLLGEHRDFAVRPSAAVRAKIGEFGENFEEVTEPHPALKLLSTVNDWMNGFELSLLRFTLLQLAGNFYLHPVMSGPGRTPGELWVMPPHLTQIIIPKDPSQGPVAGYKYGRGEKAKEFAVDEVIWWKLPNPSDPYGYGYGKVEACWSALGLHDAKRIQDQAKYDNFSRPDWIIGVEGAMADALNRLEAKLEEKYQGAHNAGKVLAANGKITAQQLNLPDPEVGDHDNLVREIAAVLGVPVYKLLGDNAVKANSEQQDAGWMRDTVLPLLRLDEEQLNAKYLTLWGLGDDAVLAYDNPVPEDKQFFLEKRKVESGGAPTRTVNELRDEDGLPPIEGGDELLIPNGLMPLGSTPFGNMMVPGMGGAAGAPVDPNAPPAIGDQQVIQTAEAAVLNGAQITAALSIVAQVAAGDIPRDAGLGMLQTLFNLTPEKAAQMMGSAGTSTPTTPNPNPRLEAQQQAQADAAAAAGADKPPTDKPAASQPATAKGIVGGDDGPTNLPQGRSRNRAGTDPADTARPRAKSGPGNGDDAGLREADSGDAEGPDGGGLHRVGAVRRGNDEGAGRKAEAGRDAAPGAGVGHDEQGDPPDRGKRLDRTDEGRRLNDEGQTLPTVRGGKGANGPERPERHHAAGDADSSSADDSAVPPVAKGAVRGRSIISAPIDSPELAALCRDVFQKQMHECVLALRGKSLADVVTKDDDKEPKPPPPLPDLIDAVKWDAALAARAKPIIAKIMRQAARDLLPKLPKLAPGTFEVVDRSLPAAAESLSLKFAESTNATTSQKLDSALTDLRDEIEQGIVQGDTQAEMAKRVQSVFTEASDERADLIAKTEASRARHRAEIVTAKESGVVKGKRWLASADACPVCDAMAAKGIVELDTPYGTTASEAYPTVDEPPAHPRCQCSQELIVDE